MTSTATTRELPIPPAIPGPAKSAPCTDPAATHPTTSGVLANANPSGADARQQVEGTMTVSRFRLATDAITALDELDLEL